MNKVCSKCKVEKPLTDFYSRVEGGHSVKSRCKSCTHIIDKVRAEKYKERRKLLDAARWKTKSEELKRYNKEFRRTHKDQIAAYKRTWYEQNRDRELARSKAYKKK